MNSRRIFRCLHAALIALGACLLMPAAVMAQEYDPIEFADPLAGQAQADESATAMLRLGLRGLHFVPNQGQWSDADIYYGLRARGLDLALRESALTMHMRRSSEHESPEHQSLTLRVTFPGSNQVTPDGVNPQAARFNYFVGGEGRGTASNVPSYGDVVYPDLYDGVDLHLTGNEDGVLKYEFHVEPGADYRPIRIHYDGIESLGIDDTGALHINTAFGALADGAPIVWQESSSSRKHIPARFELCDDLTYRIAPDGPIDPTRELIIDPELIWMTYLGGGGDERDCSAQVAEEGTVYVSGVTDSPDFEGANNATHGGEEVFLARVTTEGALVWMTYLGGSGDDGCRDVAIDSNRSACIVGWTDSTDFEGATNEFHGGRNDAFLATASSDGVLLGMMYLGGAGNDSARGVVIDDNDAIYVSGSTDSADFEGATNAYHGGDTFGDAYLLKVSRHGVMEWMMFLGGSLDDRAGEVSLLASEQAVFVCGDTNSGNFEHRTNSFYGNDMDEDAFLLKAYADGTVDWMMYLGGLRSDSASAVDVDEDANQVYVAGTTRSQDFDGRINSQFGDAEDAFVLKVSSSGDLRWMRYLGGPSWDYGRGLAVDPQRQRVLISGTTYSSDFEGAVNDPYPGTDDFLVKVDPYGTLLSMMYLGGSGNEQGSEVSVDESAGIAYVAGETGSTDFEGRNNSHHGGWRDAYLAKINYLTGDLFAIGSCPGPMIFIVYDATPNGRVAYLYARGEGSLEIPPDNPCAGVTLGLNATAQLADVVRANGDGYVRLDIEYVPSRACGRTYVQAVDLTTCFTSNVVLVQ